MTVSPSDHGPGGAAELLDVVVRLNRWVTHHSDWALPLAQVRVLSQIDEWGRHAPATWRGSSTAASRR